MKRVIVNYNKLTKDILNLLIEKYPDGYNDSDIIMFTTPSGERVEAVEVKTEDTIYLVKVSVQLEKRMTDFLDEDDNDETVTISEEKEMDFSEDLEDEASDEEE